ncbi:MAG: MFS transporter [Nocardioidaceae bacterium]
MTSTRWAVLRRKPFVIVMGGELVSMIGDSIYVIALTWLILTESTPKVLAVSLICVVVPRAVLLLVGGALTDRLSARWVMFCSHASRVALVAALAATAAWGTLHAWHFFAISAAFGVADAFFWPASKTIIATLVPAEELVEANAVNQVAEQGASLGGPALGGLLVALVGPVPALVVNAATFLVAASTIWVAPRPAAESAPRSALSVRGTLTEIREGLSYARRKPGVRVVLIIISAAALSYSGLFGVGLPALAQTFSQSAFALGLMYSCWGAGQFLGAASAGFTGLPHRWGLLIIAMAYVEGVSFAVLGFIPSLWLVAPLFVLLGFGVAYTTDVALPAWIQTTTPESVLGRVNSVIDVPRMIFEPLSIIMIGVLVSIDLRLALFGAAVPMLTAAVVLSLSPTARLMGSATGGAEDQHPSPVAPQSGRPARS